MDGNPHSPTEERVGASDLISLVFLEIRGDEKGRWRGRWRGRMRGMGIGSGAA
jgi:hypothetical protein